MDVAVVGAGAAGLAASIFTARLRPELAVALIEGARRPGAKILVSGGGRCNVTNAAVAAADFWAAGSPFVRRVLRSFTVEQTIAFFREIGVRLREEPGGKLFPESNRARTVLQALLDEADRRGVRLLTEHRVLSIRRAAAGFVVETSRGGIATDRVVLATGGLSLPKTGSDGAGYAFAVALGHSLRPRSPALDPLLLEGGFSARLSGVSQDVEITVREEGERLVRIAGALLWTHFGASGPAALDSSRFWHRGRLRGHAVVLTANLLPSLGFESAERRLLEQAAARPQASFQNTLATLLPASVAQAVLAELNVPGATPLAQLRREERRRVLRALVEWPLPVRGTRGYNFAEVTSGGVPLEEVEAATMESRRCPGLHLVGEVLDVDGRIGGFNFQWAWSSGWVAAAGIARRGAPPPGD